MLAARPKRPDLKPICHKCYETNDISPDCLLSLWHQGKVRTNYELFHPITKVAAPSEVHHRVQGALGMDRPH